MPKKLKWFEEVSFVQGAEARECLAMLDMYGERTLFLYLVGLAGDERRQSLSPWGDDDYIATYGEYVLSYNLRLNYAGLCKRL